MADYPQLTPTLGALSATKNDPQGTEAANKLDDAIRQTRLWCYDFLSTIVDETTGKIKSSAFSNSAFPAGFIRGSNPVDDSQREILQGSIQGIDIGSETIEGTNIAPQTITGNKLANKTIGTDQLGDNSVSEAKIAAGALGSSSIKDGSVTSVKLADNSVIAGKIASKAVAKENLIDEAASGKSLPVAIEGQILVGGNGTDSRELAAKPLSGAITIDKDGVASFGKDAFTGVFAYSRIVEQGSSGDGAGGGVATGGSWHMRGKSGVTRAWAINNQSRILVKLDGTTGRIYVTAAGVYIVKISCPAFRVDAHKMRLVLRPDINVADTFTYEGSSEYSAAAGAYAQTRSMLEVMLTFQKGLDPNLPYFYVEHWCETSNAVSNGLGKQVVGAGGSEFFAIVEMFKVA